MSWRQVKEADLAECLAIEPRHVGDEIVGRDRSLALWKELTRTRSFNSVVIESHTRQSPAQIIGFGSSAFVTSDFANAELARPRPGLNSRILAAMSEGNSPVRPEASLCNPDRPDALDIVILSGNHRTGILRPEEVMQAQMLLAFTFMEQHLGFHLNSILMETVSEPQRRFHESSGVWRTVQQYPGSERALIVLTREQAFAVSGSVAAPLFQYHEPVLRLRDTDKHLLSEALHGETDADLAARMHLSLPSIKKRWATLFDRIADVRPGLLPDADPGSEDNARGPQKRHRILAYLRTHPEELRPFRWRSFTQV